MKHIIPVNDMSPMLMSTGIEKQMPYTLGKDFVVRAKTDGVIKEYDQKTGIMIAQYKDGSHEAINLRNQVVKNGAGGFYIENKLDPLVKVGQKFKKEDVLASNRNYFSTGYDGTKFNLGTLAKVAIMSSFATFEDSNIVTEGLSKRMGTQVIMQKHLILGPNATVSQIVKVGDQITVGDPLITFEQSNEEESVNDLLAGIGDDLKEDIKAMGKNTLPSKYSGVIEDIRIYSTNKPSELSPSLGKIVAGYWKDIKARKDIVRKYKIDDPTYQGNTFFELDEPIKADASGRVRGYKMDAGVIIEFFIKYNDEIKPGDKICHHLALKGVVAVIIPEDEAPYTPDYPDEPIETCVAASSVLARQVVGIIPTMFTQKLIVKLKDQLKEMYDVG